MHSCRPLSSPLASRMHILASEEGKNISRMGYGCWGVLSECEMEGSQRAQPPLPLCGATEISRRGRQGIVSVVKINPDKFYIHDITLNIDTSSEALLGV